MTVIDTIEPQPGAGSLPQVRHVYDTPPDEKRDSVVRQWLQILTRWRWIVIGSVGVALIISVILTMLVTRMYTASVSLEIAREEANVVNIEGVEPNIGSLDQEFYQTQYGLLKSRSLAEAVVRELRLHRNRAFFEMFGEGDTIGPFSDLRTGPLPAEGDSERIKKAAEILLDNVSVSPERASRLVVVGFESPDPKLSADIANAWAKNFIESNLARRFEATSYAREFLEGRLQQVRQRLEESERESVNYAANNDIITIGGGGEDGARAQERSVITDNLLALNDQLARARGERIAAESRFRQSGTSDASPETLTNPAIASMLQRRAEIAAEYARLLVQFQPEYPQARALAAELEQLDGAISREEQRVRSSLQNQYREAVARETQLAARVDELQNQVIEQRRRGIQYNIYEREVDTNRELYNALLQRYKEIGVAGGVGTNNVAIVDPALPPEKPSKPRPLINLMIGLLAGVAVGVGLAFILEQIDEAISDTGDVEAVLGMPSLGSVPQLTAGDPLEELIDRKSALSEAYLSVVTALKFSTPDGLPRSLLVTSTQPGEGKSTSSVAIAVTLGRLGLQTLLIDADMRWPSLHAMLGIGNEKGLSDVLSGNSPLDEALAETNHPRLTIMSAGLAPPNAAELLSGVHVDELLRDALRRFDAVVIDAPPIMGLADSPLIASKVAGTVMVVEAHRTRARQASLALQRLRAARANMLGAVLTKFSSKRASADYGYDYGYGYGRTGETADKAS